MPAATRRRKSAGRRSPRTARKAQKTHTATPKARRTRKEKKLSRVRKPDEMSLEDWQRTLRRQFGREQDFESENLGDEPIFSEFRVTNPESQSTYRVAIRGQELGVNFCSCPDFQTNALGTCKHIEFTLAKLERKRGGKKAFREGYQPPYSEIYVQYGARRQVRFRAGEECPRKLARIIGDYFDADGVLNESAAAQFHKLLSELAEIDHDVRVYDDALALVAQLRDDRQRQRRIGEAFPDGIHNRRMQKLLKVPLYPYQREGALFAARHGRVLIGDEMGLGKTIQAIAAAEIMAEVLGVANVLIVGPTSLKHQWAREIEKFTSRSVQVIEGLQPERRQQFRSDAFFKITNYDTIHRDLDLIRELAPDLVILDEAQRIKNWDTRAARSVKQIQSPYCVVLTGTPLENRLQELISIVQFIDQHRLGPTYRVLHEHQVTDDNGRVTGYRNLDQLGRTLEPILIRRQKKEVLDQLPERLEKNLFVPMTEQQAAYHEENRETVARIAQKWRKFGFLREADQRRLMIALQNMRMACNSTYLLDRETDHSTKPDELAAQLADLMEAPATKVVIFSQWTRTHELIIRRMNGRPYSHVLFHGGVPSKKRKTLVDRFREDDDCRVFLSTDAGGVGLNLQHANVVVNMDLPWNPAVLEQRIGRVHRLGQTQPVQVINFVAKGTIEEGMLSTLAFKKSLFAGVLDGGEKEVFLGESRLKKFMNAVESVTSQIDQAWQVSTTAVDGMDGIDGMNDGRSEALTDRRREGRTRSPARAAAATAAPGADPLASLLQMGAELLGQLSQAASGDAVSRGPAADRNRHGLALQTERDPDTGRSYVKLPLPGPEVLSRATEAVASLLAAFGRR